MTRGQRQAGKRRGGVASGAARFALLFGLWLALSGRLHPLELGLGALSAALVTVLTTGFLFRRPVAEAMGEPAHHGEHLRPIRFLLYLPWLFVQIVRANLQVAYLVLHPRMPVDPVLIRFATPLRGHPSQVMLGHSITLTPGTITADAREGTLLVHAITPGAAELLLSGRLQRRVEDAFAVPSGPRTEAVVRRNLRELDL